jgi:hypothetical protein
MPLCTFRITIPADADIAFFPAIHYGLMLPFLPSTVDTREKKTDLFLFHLLSLLVFGVVINFYKYTKNAVDKP